MSPQADFIVSNGTGAAVRSDLNVQFAAIVSNNSGATEPATMYAYQWWADTTAGLLKIRNAANNAWITLRELDGTLLMEDGTAAAPGLSFASDPDSGIFRGGANEFGIATNGVERVEFGTSEVVFNDGGANYDFRIEGDTNANLFFVDASAEAVGIGTTGPSQLLHINSTGTSAILRVSSGSAGVNTSTSSIQLSSSFSGSGVEGTAQINANAPAGGQSELAFLTSASGNSPTERARIDSSGRLLVNTSTARTDIMGTGAQLQVEGNSFATSRLGVMCNINNAESGAIYLSKSRGSSAGGVAVVSNDDKLGDIEWGGTDGTNIDTAARITAFVDGTPGANVMPGRLVFSTTANGASTPTERMRITNGGNFRINQTTTDDPAGTNTQGLAFGSAGWISTCRDGATPLLIGRKGNDGTLVEFSQDGTYEGNISVSGTTVSYNGAHLSRWSQLPSGAERTEILRGSVLSNLDEMCEWGEEENEQLNRMKVSDVEGDKNVSGVFQAWDDDDDTYINDFYCAMTGDFVIRIAQGVTVERGDLLMSAGDGTAKPQDDDIIRSKTIAKVTSTNVSCTYEDGSYCVPCVLMAC
jgi:hypothetical protein